MRRFVITLFFALLFFSPAVFAGTLTFGVLPDFPPYAYEVKGQLTGIDVDSVKEACRRMKVVPEFRVMPWKRSLAKVKNGDITALCAALRTEEREAFLHYSGEPVHIQRNVLMARKGDGIKVTELGNLKDRIVGVVRKFSYGQAFGNCKGLRKSVYNDQEELVRILDKGRIDLAAAAEVPFRFIAKGLGFQNRFEAIYTITEIPAYTVFSKKALGQEGEVLAKKFGSVLRQMRKEGTIREILDKYR